MPVMTPAQTRAHEVGSPSLPQLLLAAMLCVFAELVRNVVSTLQMSWLTRKRDWHTHDGDPALPRETSDTIKEPHSALMLRSAAKLRLSKHSGALTNMSRTSPSPSVSHATRAIHLPLLRMGRQVVSHNEGELPPSVRSTGGGGLRALARKTEGTSHALRSSRRKSGPRASRVICATGLRKQPWIPACAGTSGDSVTSSTKTALV